MNNQDTGLKFYRTLIGCVESKPEDKILRYNFCGNCGQLLGKPFDADQIKLVNIFCLSQPLD